MTICMCFAFEVFLLVDMSLLVLSGPQPILNLNFVLLFQIWWSLSILSRYILWPRKGIFSAHRHFIFPQLYQKVFIIAQIIMGGDSCCFSFFSLRAVIIILPFGSLLLPFGLKCLELSSQGAPSFQVGKDALHLPLVTLVLADTTVACEAAYKVFTDNLSWMCFSRCSEIPGKLASLYNCT